MAKKEKNKKKKLEKKAQKKAAKKAKKAAKEARKAAKAAQKAKKKATKKQKKPAKKAKATSKAKVHGRLPPNLRHPVEEDDPRERATGTDDETFADSGTGADEAAELGEGFVRGVTSGEAETEMEDEESTEEQGGPFIQTSAASEFGYGTDASNPPDAEPAGLPSVSPPIKPKLD